MRKVEFQQRLDGWWYRLFLDNTPLCDWQFGGIDADQANDAVADRFGDEWASW